jgi:hypothetical protein
MTADLSVSHSVELTAAQWVQWLAGMLVPSLAYWSVAKPVAGKVCLSADRLESTTASESATSSEQLKALLKASTMDGCWAGMRVPMTVAR